MKDHWTRLQAAPYSQSPPQGPTKTSSSVPNVFSGIGESLMDTAPGLILVVDHGEERGQSPSVEVARVLCKRVFDVSVGDEIAVTVAEAAALVSPPRAVVIVVATVSSLTVLISPLPPPPPQARSGVPGPVCVRIPAPILDSEAATQQKPVAKSAVTLTAPAPTPAVLTEIADDLLSADVPRIHLGLGASDMESAPLVREIVDLTGAIVSTTFSGKGAFPETHPLWLWAGVGPALPLPLRSICRECDLWLILGTSLLVLFPLFGLLFLVSLVSLSSPSLLSSLLPSLPLSLPPSLPPSSLPPRSPPYPTQHRRPDG